MKIDHNTGLPLGWHEIRDHNEDQFFYKSIGRMIFGTYEPAAMNSKSQAGKLPLSRLPQEGEDPNPLVKFSSPLALQQHEYRMKVNAEAAKLAASMIIPSMTEDDKQRYTDGFTSIPKEDPLHINMAEAYAHCKEFDIPPTTLFKILSRTDSNKDSKWNVDEYANALHEMNGKSPDSQTMTEEEVMAVCKDVDISDELVRKLFYKMDENKDMRWNVDELIRAIHRVMDEVEKKEEFRKLVPKKPVISTPAITSESPSPSISPEVASI
ncbi:hypothetical protein B7463_g1554, partial [Scytalidium lignicola]